MEALMKMMRLLVLVPFLLILAHRVSGNIGHFDDVWQKRAVEARRIAKEAYNPNPENVTNHFNKAVRR